MATTGIPNKNVPKIFILHWLALISVISWSASRCSRSLFDLAFGFDLEAIEMSARRGMQRPKRGDRATRGALRCVEVENCMESGKDLVPTHQAHDNVSRTSRVLCVVENTGTVDIVEKLVLPNGLQASLF